MAHKTLIGGTAYEIGGGKTLVSGTAHSVDKGKTLVGGTAYEIGFGPKVSIISNPDYIAPLWAGATVEIDGVTYGPGPDDDATLTVPVGSVIRCTISARGAGNIGRVYVNGAEVAQVAGTADSTTKSLTYSYTVTSETTVYLTGAFTSLSSLGFCGYVSILTTPSVIPSTVKVFGSSVYKQDTLVNNSSFAYAAINGRQIENPGILHATAGDVLTLFIRSSENSVMLVSGYVNGEKVISGDGTSGWLSYNYTVTRPANIVICTSTSGNVSHGHFYITEI